MIYSVFRTTIGVALLGVCTIFFSWCVSAQNEHEWNSVPVSQKKGPRAADSLKLVIAMSRHGNRGSNKDYPTDPYPINNTAFWPYRPMMLTMKGREQSYNLGKKLRSVYDGFLPTIVHSDEVYASSTDTERTALSGQMVLAGLFPPEGFQRWDDSDLGQLWQPVALYTNNTDTAQLVPICPRYTEESSRCFSQVEKREAYNISEMSDFISKSTGVRLTTAKELYDLTDKLYSEAAEGYKLPVWTNPLYPDRLLDLFSKLMTAICLGNEQIIRLSVGKVLEEVIPIMKNKAEGSLRPDRKFYYYSAHDYTVLGLAYGLGVAIPDLPRVINVASALVIELHQDPDTAEYYVQVVYIDGLYPDADPQELPMASCGTPCKLLALLDFSERYMDVDLDSECKSVRGSKGGAPSSQLLSGTSVLVLLVLSLVHPYTMT